MKILGGMIAFCGGIAVAFSTAAFILALGIVPRIAAISGTVKKILFYETVVMCGMYAGLLLELDVIRMEAGIRLLSLLGLAGGIFAGCWTCALGELFNMYAVIFRRLHIRVLLSVIVWALCLGKAAGAFLALCV